MNRRPYLKMLSWSLISLLSTCFSLLVNFQNNRAYKTFCCSDWLVALIGSKIHLKIYYFEGNSGGIFRLFQLIVRFNFHVMRQPSGFFKKYKSPKKNHQNNQVFMVKRFVCWWSLVKFQHEKCWHYSCHFFTIPSLSVLKLMVFLSKQARGGRNEKA